MIGKTSLLKYFAAPAGPPTTTSFGSARTMRGAPISAPTAETTLVLSSARRDGLHNVIGFAPGQPAFEPSSKRCARCAHFHNYLKMCWLLLLSALARTLLGTDCAHSMLMN